MASSRSRWPFDERGDVLVDLYLLSALASELCMCGVVYLSTIVLWYSCMY